MKLLKNLAELHLIYCFCVHAGLYTFTPANGTRPEINYYIDPEKLVNKLSSALIEGKFCLLYGHRQSGKSTAAYATMRCLSHLAANTKIGGYDQWGYEIFYISFGSGIVVNEETAAFWSTLWV